MTVRHKTKSKSGHRGMKRVDLAHAELASTRNVRDTNRDIVLEITRSKQPVSRADLARLSGLQPSTVSSIVRQLIREKWIIEGGQAKLPRGRRPVMLTLNQQLVMLVADLRPGHAILAVVDINGHFLSRESILLASDATRASAKLADALYELRERYPDKTFEGVGVSVPGRVDPETQRIILAPNLHWANFDLKNILEDRLELRVELDNDANACMVSALWYGQMEGVRNAVLIAVAEGIGSAILVNGQLVAGRRGLAGEFGHIPIDSTGPLCGCGTHGCWETFASSKAALRYYNDSTPAIPVRTIRDLLNLAVENDASALAALERQARALGRGLRLVTAALSPEMIIIIGDITALWSRLGPFVEEEMAASMLVGDPPHLFTASDGELARLRGAAALVLQRHSGSERSTQPSREPAGMARASLPGLS